MAEPRPFTPTAFDRLYDRGWGLPRGSDVFHYFSGPRSLCRMFVMHGPYGSQAHDSREEVCRECRARVNAWEDAAARAAKAKEGGR